VSIRVALPKGRLLAETAVLLDKAGWRLAGYDSALRNYRLTSETFPEIQFKVFQEKDIPVQVSIGNYDLGICGLDWIEELSSKYAAARLVKVRDLGYGKGSLFVAASCSAPLTLDRIRNSEAVVSVASEYPNIAESFALSNRLRRFSVFPVWGGADAYPPESATLALVAGGRNESSLNQGLVPVTRVLDFSAQLIANRRSWEQKDLSNILRTLEQAAVGKSGDMIKTEHTSPFAASSVRQFPVWEAAHDLVRIALPDGHQQKPAVALLEKAGIRIDDYPSATGNRRPAVGLDGVFAKVIRPQDMPLQVANGNFDLAITGHDWLTDHMAAFPSSPVRELLDLKFARVRIVAVVAGNVPADNIYGVRRLLEQGEAVYRVASEYANLADKYARENHLGMYRVIPTWGATEAFLPEDADLLIENTETGSTIARHNLKIIDEILISTGRLIGRRDGGIALRKRARLNRFVKMLAAAVAD
jgi:ATP phosphoribosyltransferase